MVKSSVLGAGAVGGYVAGMIAGHHLPITLLCRPAQKTALLEAGLSIRGPEGRFHVPATDLDSEGSPENGNELSVTTDPGKAVRKADLLFVCVKSQDTEDLLRSVAPHITSQTSVVLLQNGVRNKALVEEYLPENPCLEAVVLFNSLYLKPGEVTLTATESVIFDSEARETPAAQAASGLLQTAGISTRFHPNVRGILWTKLVINLNNGLSALTGGTLFEGLRDRDTRHLGRSLMAEGIRVLETAGIALEPIPKVDPARLMWLLKTPGWFAALVMKLLIKPYCDVQSSTWQSRVRGRPTEVAYLNGEIVTLAAECGAEAPLNGKILEMVLERDRTGDDRTYTPKELREILGI